MFSAAKPSPALQSRLGSPTAITPFVPSFIYCQITSFSIYRHVTMPLLILSPCSILSPTERAVKFAAPPAAQEQDEFDDDNDDVEADDDEETDAPSVFNRIGKPKNVCNVQYRT